MAKVTIGSLKPEQTVPSQEQLDEQAQSLFVDYLNKCREIYGQRYNHESEIDSEVSLHMHHMLGEYDKYRIGKEHNNVST